MTPLARPGDYAIRLRGWWARHERLCGLSERLFYVFLGAALVRLSDNVMVPMIIRYWR